MGGIECCRKSDKVDQNFEVRDLFKNNNECKLKLTNSTVKREYTNHQDELCSARRKINLLSEEPMTTKGFTSEKETNINENIIKIQKKYREHQLKKNFDNKIKPSIQEKERKFVEELHHICAKGGQIEPDEDFMHEDWKKYYPQDERFFLFDKGEVYQNQIRVNNGEDFDNLEIYEGETNINNLRHGYGVLTTPYHVLKGTWRNGEFTGWGRESRRNGEVLEGKFVNGTLNGKGFFKNPDGSLYIGDFINSNRHGKGELKTLNFEYVGDFENNMLSGKGKIQFLNDGSEYEGDFLNNDIEGKGTFRWINGDIYVGEMKKGKMDGYGKYTHKDGQVYEGFYNKGLKEGHGKLTYPDMKSYDGEFRNGLPHGIGIFTQNGQSSKVEFSKGKFIKRIQ